MILLFYNPLNSIMQSIKFKLKKYHLTSKDVLNSMNINKRLQQFSKDLYKSLRDNYKTFNSNEKVIKIFSEIFNLLQTQTPFKSFMKTTWMKLLFIQSIINWCPHMFLTDQVVGYLDQFSENLFINLNQQINKKNTKNNLFNKVKKILSFQNDKFNQKESQKIFTDILKQYLFFIRLKIKNWYFIKYVIQQSKEVDLQTIQLDQDIDVFRQEVWKIINLLKNHYKMCKIYRVIDTIDFSFKPLMVATLGMFAIESVKMYPFIKKLIKIDQEIVKKQYSNIQINKNLQKQIKIIKIKQISETIAFIQVQNLLKQLNDINQVLFYIFCGKRHADYINIFIPDKFFLNTTSKALDQINQIILIIKNIIFKKNKQKLYLSSVNDKFDQSIQNLNKSKHNRNLSFDLQIEYKKISLNKSIIQPQQEQFQNCQSAAYLNKAYQMTENVNYNQF